MLAKVLTGVPWGQHGARLLGGAGGSGLRQQAAELHRRRLAGRGRVGGTRARPRRHPQLWLPLPEQASRAMLQIASWTKGQSGRSPSRPEPYRLPNLRERWAGVLAGYEAI